MVVSIIVFARFSDLAFLISLRIDTKPLNEASFYLAFSSLIILTIFLVRLRATVSLIKWVSKVSDKS